MSDLILPRGVYPILSKTTGDIVSYKVRWREPDGSHPSRNFKSLKEATDHLEDVAYLARRGQVPDRATAPEANPMTLADLGQEWLRRYAVPKLSETTIATYVALWDAHVIPRIGHYRVAELIDGPHLFVEFQEALEAAGIGPSSQRKTYSLISGIWGKGMIWHPRFMTRNIPRALFELPSGKSKRFVRPLPPIAVERVRAALLARSAVQGSLAPMREATFVSCMAYLVAVRPGELLALTWDSLGERTVRIEWKASMGIRHPGTKNGTIRVALPYRQALEDLAAWRAALEERYGPQADTDLIFPDLSSGGVTGSAAYKNFARRSWRDACLEVSQSKGLEWLASARVYDLRHTAISYKLREHYTSTEVAAIAGNTPGMVDRRYSHVIAEAKGGGQWDVEAAIDQARTDVAAGAA